MSQLNQFPTGWDEERVQSVIRHYERQTEDDAVAEDEAARADPKCSFVAIPVELLPAVRELLANHDANALDADDAGKRSALPGKIASES